MTRSDLRWMRSKLGTVALVQEVVALRCGLDSSLWDDAAKAASCAEMLKTGLYDTSMVRNALPFDIGRARALYEALLGPVEDLIKGKHLLIVPSGPLTQLPFQVLVTEASGNVKRSGPDAYGNIA